MSAPAATRRVETCPCCGTIIPTHRIQDSVAECPRTRCRRRFTPGGDPR